MFHAPKVQTVDSQSQSGYGELDDDNVEDEDVKEEEKHEGTVKVKPIKSVIDIAPSTVKMKKPTAHHSSMYGLNQEAITMCNQAGGKLFPCLKDEALVHGNVAMSHIGMANAGNHPTYYGVPGGRNTFIPPPTHEIRVGGVALELSSEPLATALATFVSLQHWVASKQEELKPNAHESFHKSVTSNIPSKNNKLESMVIKTKLPNLLKSAENPQGQLEVISVHLHSHDCVQVMTIVLPVDASNMSKIHEKMCGLL